MDDKFQIQMYYYDCMSLIFWVTRTTHHNLIRARLPLQHCLTHLIQRIKCSTTLPCQLLILFAFFRPDWCCSIISEFLSDREATVLTACFSFTKWNVKVNQTKWKCSNAAWALNHTNPAVKATLKSSAKVLVPQWHIPEFCWSKMTAEADRWLCGGISMRHSLRLEYIRALQAQTVPSLPWPNDTGAWKKKLFFKQEQSWWNRVKPVWNISEWSVASQYKL